MPVGIKPTGALGTALEDVTRDGARGELVPILRAPAELVDQGAEDALITAARDVMENAADPVVKLDVKLTVDAGTGPNWAVAH